MQIDDIEETRQLLDDINNLFSNLEDTKRKLESQINTKEDETIDYLHELELGKLNALEIMKVSKEIIRIRKERRVLKDKLELIKTLKGYTDKYITKGITAETTQAIKNIDTLKSNQENREYTPKVIQGLKCAKKKKSEFSETNSNISERKVIICSNVKNVEK